MLAESDPEPRPCKFTRMKNTLLIQQRHASVADVDLEMHCVMHLQTPSSQTQCWKSYCSRDKVPPSVYRISVQQAQDPKATESHVDSINHGIAFAGLVSYIEEVRWIVLLHQFLNERTWSISIMRGCSSLEHTHLDIYTSLNSRIEY